MHQPIFVSRAAVELEGDLSRLRFVCGSVREINPTWGIDDVRDLECETGGVFDDRSRLYDREMLAAALSRLRHVGAPCGV